MTAQERIADDIRLMELMSEQFESETFNADDAQRIASTIDICDVYPLLDALVNQERLRYLEDRFRYIIL